MDKSNTPEGWTRESVEIRLIAAFRLMPSCPVFSAGGRLNTVATAGPTALTDVLAWSALLDGDPAARRCLWSWARCRATRASFGEFCREMGWSRSTAEAARRRGAAAIVAALVEGIDRAATGSAHATRLRLDGGKVSAGASRRVRATCALADTRGR